MHIYQYKELVGNANTLSFIKRSIINGSFPKFTILSGVMGTGKTTCAGITGLALTCENPVNGEPCLKCHSCLNNIKALETTGESYNLKKVNLGKLTSKKDVTDLINNIFVLNATDGACVYLLEEMHTLSSLNNSQAAFLEELDRMPDNVYVIGTTTKLYDLLPELVSRSIHFDFGRLNRKESALLLQLLKEKNKYDWISSDIAEIILNYSNGIPRDITNLTEFINSTAPTLEEVQKFLHYVDNETLIGLFTSMQSDNVTESINYAKDLVEAFGTSVVIKRLKDFILNVIFYVDGGICDEFSDKERKLIRGIFTKSNAGKIAGMLESASYKINETDLMFLIFRMRMALLDKSVGSLVTGTSKAAAVQKTTAKINYTEREEIKQDNQNNEELKKLSIDSLDFFGD